jgi:trans-aconitate 2-methyltransferase
MFNGEYPAMNKNDLWDGKQYKANSSPQEVSATEIIHSLDFNGSEFILDIGCGDGRITNAISHLIPNGKLIGIDASTSMIAEATKHAATNDKLLFLEMGAEDFSFMERFDYIFSFHTLHWVKDKVKVFKNIYDHLKDNGKFIFITSGRENQNIANVFSSNQWQNQLKGHGQKFHSTDEHAIKSMLQEAGLSIESLKAEYWSKYYSNKDELINWLMTWVPYATGLDKEHSMLFSDEITDNMLRESVKHGLTDKIEFTTEMLSIKTNKMKC